MTKKQSLLLSPLQALDSSAKDSNLTATTFPALASFSLLSNVFLSGHSSYSHFIQLVKEWLLELL